MQPLNLVWCWKLENRTFNYSDRNLYLFSPSISFQIFVIETCKNIIKKIKINFKKSRMFQNVQKWGLKLPKNTQKNQKSGFKKNKGFDKKSALAKSSLDFRLAKWHANQDC